MNMVIIIGTLGVIAALLLAGEVAWVFRGREFAALCRQIDDLNRKLADAESRLREQQERMTGAETSLAEANTRSGWLAKVERELDEERKSASALSMEIAQLREQAKADVDAKNDLPSARLKYYATNSKFPTLILPERFPSDLRDWRASGR